MYKFLPAPAPPAEEMQRRDRRDQANQRPAHRPKLETLNNTKNDVKGFPMGNSVEAALRRLRKDRPELGSVGPSLPPDPDSQLWNFENCAGHPGPAESRLGNSKASPF
jgi:hypothetical protein